MRCKGWSGKKNQHGIIVLSSATDPYLQIEAETLLTRKLLEVCLEFNQPVGILTKNSWILKDKDVLQEMAKKRLVSAMVSITSFNEDLRRVMEPRTTTAKQKLKVINELSSALTSRYSSSFVRALQ